jgi:hypothetical protein
MAKMMDQEAMKQQAKRTNATSMWESSAVCGEGCDDKYVVQDQHHMYEAHDDENYGTKISDIAGNMNVNVWIFSCLWRRKADKLQPEQRCVNRSPKILAQTTLN